jgi:hypothetical protein
MTMTWDFSTENHTKYSFLGILILYFLASDFYRVHSTLVPIRKSHLMAWTGSLRCLLGCLGKKLWLGFRRQTQFVKLQMEAEKDKGIINYIVKLWVSEGRHNL